MGRICGHELVYCMVLMFGAFTFGYVIAYPSPAIPQMKKEFHDLTDLETSFFNSISSLCAIAGPFITAALLRCIGRRPVVFMISVFGTVSWLLMLAINKNIFWFGILVRGLSGLAMGAYSSVIPMYIVELAPPESTGFFGSLNQLGIAIGILFCYLVGNYVDWRPNAIVASSLTAVLCVLVWLIPESPAVAQMKVLSMNEDENKKKGCEVFQKKWLFPLFVCGMFMLFQQFSGVNAILTNLTDLFQSAGVELEPGIASAVSSLAQVISVFVGGLLIEKWGRKVVWVVSFGGITIADFLYALCRYESLQEKFPSWFPIVVIFLFLLAFGMGAGPIPWFIVSEMFPSSVRAQAVSVVSVTNWVLAFLVIEVFPFMQKGMKDFGCFILFTVFSFVGTIFGLKFVRNPEVDNTNSTTTGQYDELVSNNYT